MFEYIPTIPTAALIARGRELTASISAAEAELKAIDEELRHRALAMPHEPLAQGNREGRRARLRDGDEELTVLFESDILKASFASDSPVARDLLPLLTKDQITNLFRCKTTYERSVKDGHKFRLQCSELLEPDLASVVIDKLKDRDRNGIVKSKSVIEWKP
jgi:hypothetical protein